MKKNILIFMYFIKKMVGKVLLEILEYLRLEGSLSVLLIVMIL